MFARVCFPFVFLFQLWLVLVPAIFGFMVVSPAIGAGIFILLVTIVCKVSFILAKFASEFEFLIHLLIVVICFHVFKLRYDAVEKQWLALVGSPLGAIGYVRCAGTGGMF